MNRDLFGSNFLELQDLQPASHGFDPFDLAQASTNASAAYEMMGRSVGVVGAAQELPAAFHAASSLLRDQEPRKRSASHFNDGYEAMSSCDLPSKPSTATLPLPTPRKRKGSSYGTPSAYEDDDDDVRSTRTAPDKKQNHSEIEKRRRDKMNTYITELSAMVPMCGAMSRKLDKLTVLRMAVQHLRSVRGALAACPLSARPRPACLSERELNALVLHAARDAFLLVVGCDRGRVLYASASAAAALHCDRADLLGQSLFDVLHPKDVAKVKEQLSSSDLSPRERLVDAKTMLPLKAEVGAGASRLCPGARRSFFCRIRRQGGARARVKEEGEKRPHERKWCAVQCTGYLKSWAPAEMAERGGCAPEDGDAASLSCLVAVGRVLPPPPASAPAPHPAPPLRRTHYISRHAIDGKYLFVDQRVTPALGFLAQELVGTSLYEYVSGPELGAVARAHKAALLRRDSLHTPPYRCRRKDGSVALLQTHFKPLRNPWTKDVECLVARNTLLSESDPAREGCEACEGALVPAALPDAGSQSESDADVQRLIDSRVEAHKIGSAIAEEVMRRTSVDFSPELPPELLQDAFDHQGLVSEEEAECASQQVRNNVPLSAAGACVPAGAAGPGPAGAAPLDDAGEYPPAAMALDGNGEAAIAVIMSLLEADAGLGGPVNFSGLPWPLP